MDAQQTFTVTDADTAEALGSGSLLVLATPRLLAWCEAVTCAAVATTLRGHQTSVGTRVALEHTTPSPIGATVAVRANSAYVDGRLVRFNVSARQDGKLVGNGEVTRVIVDSEKFMARLGA